jgi:hypothetical protein
VAESADLSENELLPDLSDLNRLVDEGNPRIVLMICAEQDEDGATAVNDEVEPAQAAYSAERRSWAPSRQ